MKRVVVAGVAMTRFAKWFERGLKDLTREAVSLALADAGITKDVIEAAYVGNAVAGVITGQEMIRGQVALQGAGIGGIPIYNIENACASSSTALNLAAMAIEAGMYDCVLVLGTEKMTHPEKQRSFQAYEGAVDMDNLAAYQREMGGATLNRSMFMDLYARHAREYMQLTGATQHHFAIISAKNHVHGSLNPYAQYQTAMSTEEILRDRLIVDPLTRAMCAPVSDGAAAVIVCSRAFARKHAIPPVYVVASVVLSTDLEHPDGPGVITRTSRKAYVEAGIVPEDIDVFELHDATASAEMMAYEEIGICAIGEGIRLVEERATTLRGAIPVNPSGGLECKGHPIGATGLGQVVELTWQLRGQAGDRQVGNHPNIALAQNAGGHLGKENAVCSITILKR